MEKFALVKRPLPHVAGTDHPEGLKLPRIPVGLTSLLLRAQCEAVDYSGSASPVMQADPEKLKKIFDKYASVADPVTGERFMTSENFIRDYLGSVKFRYAACLLCLNLCFFSLYTEENYNTETVGVLASAADTTKDGRISFDEFRAFEAILCAPDAIYLTAFEMFDTNASETITFDEFQRVIRLTRPVIDMDFNFE